jgi:hypothetical protein
MLKRALIVTLVAVAALLAAVSVAGEQQLK